MDPEAIAGMIFTLILTMMIGGFILLYPLSRRLGQLLEHRMKDKMVPPALPPGELEALQQSIQTLEAELHRIGERQEFVEQLLSGKPPDALPAQDA
jgi:hypothetical protein